MITVPATEFSKNFGRYRELVQHEPVAVMSHERVAGYFVARTEYEQYLQVKSLLPKVYAVEELPNDTVRKLAQSEMDDRHDSLNSLLDE